jgi:hypothetical protein
MQKSHIENSRAGRKKEADPNNYGPATATLATLGHVPGLSPETDVNFSFKSLLFR